MGKKKDFDKITKLINYNEDKQIVLNKIKLYISQYGISDGILDQLGKLFIHNEDFKIAKEYLTMIKNKRSITLYHLLIANFVLENYNDVISIYYELLNNKALYNQISERMFFIINRLYLYSKFKLGLNDNYDKLDLIINYSKEKALKHIKKHTHYISYKEKHSIFNSNIDITNLYDELSNIINNSNKAYTDYLTDCYYFGYYNIGKEDDKQCDYLSVITIHNSNNIISMFPLTLKEIKDNYPINSVNETYNKTLYKSRLSQKDKFNLKYNKN